MRSAVVILSMVAAIAAEAPYHLPRPAGHAPSFSYPASPAPPPPPPPPQPQPRPQPQFIQYPPQPAPQYIQGPGYHYQQPNIAPTFVQPAPQLHPHFHSHPSAPQTLPVIPQQQYAQPHPLISYPQQQYVQPQPIAQPQAIPQAQPSLTYGQPQHHIAPAPIQPLPAYYAPQPQPQPQLLPQPQPQPRPQPQPAPIYQPISYYQPQVTSQQGYSYQQPQPQTVQHTSQLPLQGQPLNSIAASSSLSSYQADSNQYSGASAQPHSEALDSTVLDRVQNIIRDNEHSSARNAGYLSLVSGVSLEGARPSIEISSFVQNSPLATTSQGSEHNSVAQSSSSQSSTASVAASAPSQDYGFPTITANSQPTQQDASIAFLPQSKPATSYGSPQ